MLSLICAWKYDWVNNREAGDLSRRHSAHHDVTVMFAWEIPTFVDIVRPGLTLSMPQLTKIKVFLVVAKTECMEPKSNIAVKSV